MHIERLDIGGFGHFANTAWALDAGLTVMIGENEAGKTTMLNALRAILFGFELSRDGRAWYPALAGGRRGGRMTLVTAAGERWTVERFGQRGGAGSLTVRAPSGNQGGQETLDRLLRGADRDLFNSIFAFGLGELSDFDSLGGEGVRGRIYGAAAGLGGTSAVDLERRLRQEQEDLFRPSGRLQPINQLFSRMDELHARIGQLTRQPEEFEAAHRERVDVQAAAASRREEGRTLRARVLRLHRLLDAAPVVAVLDELDAELAGTDATLDVLPADAVAILDRRLASLAEARTRLEALDEQLAEIEIQASRLSVDDRILERADEIRALEADRRARAAPITRQREASAAEARHAAAVAEQLARAGGWDEASLVALDDSIAAIETTREHERALAVTREAIAAAERRLQSASDEVAARERDEMPSLDDEAIDAKSLAALRQVERARARSDISAKLGRPIVAATVGLGLVAAGLVAGIALDAPVPGSVIGALLAVVAAAAVLVGSRGTGRSVDTALLGAAGLPPDATDDDVARRSDELAEARVRRSIARDRAGSVERRREEVRHLGDALTVATAAFADAEAGWRSWLSDRGMPAGAAPEVARQVLAAAGVARRAAAERDEQRRILATIDRDGADLDRRARTLLDQLGIGEDGPVDGRLASLVLRLEQSSTDHRAAQEMEARRRTIIERRGPIDASVKDLSSSVEDHLASLACADADQLRSRDAAAVERRAIQQRLREARARLAGIAGGPHAVDALRAELRERDLAAVEAELASSSDEADALEAEERMLMAREGELDARIRALESAEELGTLRQELAGLEGRASALASEWAVKAITGRLLSETRSRYERERQPDVVRAASTHFARITGGRYARIVAPPGDASVRVETEEGNSRATHELSRGTAEQLYLALRFGLIEEFAQHAEPLPVVMDDILVNFDAGRAERAADAIGHLAERHQVLFFTCHRPMARLLDPDGGRTVALT